MTEEIVDARFSQEVDLERLLSEVGEGFKLVVRRAEPEWCDGHLATISLDPNEPVSMDSLRKRFGGRKLQFKIQKPNGDYVAHRTVKFPDQPRHNGTVMIEGQGWGDYPNQGQQAMQGQPGNGSGQFEKMFDLVLTGQRETSKLMIDTLSTRVNSLETALQTAQDRAMGITPTPAPETSQDAFSGIKDSIRTIQEIEKFKEAMGVAEKVNPSMIETGLEKIMDLMLKKEEMKMEAAMNQQAHAQKAPALDAGSCYVAPTGAALNPETMNDMELASYVKKRLEGLSEQERLNIISEVAGIDLVEDDEDDDSGQENVEQLPLDQGLPGVELTEQDEQRLDTGNNATQGAPKPA